MPDVQLSPPVDLQQQRYEQLIKLMQKWSEEDPAYDTMVMDELRKVDDVAFRCEDRDETSA